LTKHKLFAILRKMKDRSNISDNPFGERRDEVLAVAAELYRSQMTGVDPDPAYSSVSPINQVISGDPAKLREELRREEVRAAELTVSARAAARFASLLDQSERGGFSGVLAKVELAGSRLMQAREFEQAMVEGGVVDAIRSSARV
jgi:hypothetical protein